VNGYLRLRLLSRDASLGRARVLRCARLRLFSSLKFPSELFCVRGSIAGYESEADEVNFGAPLDLPLDWFVLFLSFQRRVVSGPAFISSFNSECNR